MLESRASEVESENWKVGYSFPRVDLLSRNKFKM